MIVTSAKLGRGELPVAAFSILGRVNMAMQLIASQYPGAQLYQVDGAFSARANLEDGMALDCIEFLFKIQDGGVVRLTSTPWGGVGPIQYTPYPWLEGRIIPWPISMDLSDAIAFMRKAGYEAPCKTMALRWPLFPGVLEPFYIFGLANQTFIFVGVYTRSVMVHP